MGKPSDRKKSAQRPGKRERALVKRHHRSSVVMIVPGEETIHAQYGRKKWDRFWKWFHKSRQLVDQ